jgi:small subunit ribosomal protein S4
MGNPKFPRKKYTTPLHPWKEERIKSEREFLKKYGLKNHREVWKAKTYLGKYRHQARELLAKLEAKDPQVKKESDQLLLRLTRLGILPAGSSLDDVLALETESVLTRRLQTLVYLKGLSSTPDHSRQLITHGHIAIGDKVVTIPSYMVIRDEENEIGYTRVSPLNELSHPARPKTDIYKKGVFTEEPVKDVTKESQEPPIKPSQKDESMKPPSDSLKEKEITRPDKDKKEDKTELESMNLDKAKADQKTQKITEGTPVDATKDSVEKPDVEPTPVSKQQEEKKKKTDLDNKSEKIETEGGN